MEFISDKSPIGRAHDAQLQDYLEQNAGKFARPAELTFRQVYLNAERAATARADAEKLLAELQAGRGPADPAEAGDATLLPATMEAASPQAIARPSARSSRGNSTSTGRTLVGSDPIRLRPAPRQGGRTRRRQGADAGRDPRRSCCANGRPRTAQAEPVVPRRRSATSTTFASRGRRPSCSPDRPLARPMSASLSRGRSACGCCSLRGRRGAGVRGARGASGLSRDPRNRAGHVRLPGRCRHAANTD